MEILKEQEKEEMEMRMQVEEVRVKQLVIQEERRTKIAADVRLR